MTCFVCKTEFGPTKVGQVLCSRRCIRIATRPTSLRDYSKIVKRKVKPVIPGDKLDLGLISILYSNVILKDGHWLWRHSYREDTYGIVTLWRRPLMAHRLSISVYLKIDYDDLKWTACHLCDYKSCINPLHVYQGNARTNMEDLQRARANDRPHSITKFR